MRTHSHGLICALDTFIRNAWHGQSQFALSEALKASARQKKHDSSCPWQVTGQQLPLTEI
jgi:hypothetical protein